MTTLAKVRAAANRIGATVEDTKIGSTHECRVQAPAGFRWAEDLHEFVDCANRPWKPDYADLLARMAYGYEVCDDPDCEWCNEEGPCRELD